MSLPDPIIRRFQVVLTKGSETKTITAHVPLFDISRDAFQDLIRCVNTSVEIKEAQDNGFALDAERMPAEDVAKLRVLDISLNRNHA